jgi:hypothetical protein
VDAVGIGSASAHLRSAPSLGPEADDPTLDYLVADLSVDRLAATKRSTRIPHPGGVSLPTSSWGWLLTAGAGQVRQWTSLESDLKVEARRHVFGHVQLHVTLRQAPADWGNRGWRASADLTLEPGEQLSRVAVIKDLVNLSP